MQWLKSPAPLMRREVRDVELGPFTGNDAALQVDAFLDVRRVIADTLDVLCAKKEDAFSR